MSSKAITNLIIIAIVLVLGYFGYQYFTSPPVAPMPSGAPAVIVVGASDLSTSSPADQFRQLLTSISNVDFEGSHPIFTDQIFVGALDDFSRPLPVIDARRDNPFAPLGKDALSAYHAATVAVNQLNISTSSSTSRTVSTTSQQLPTPTATSTAASNR